MCFVLCKMKFSVLVFTISINSGQPALSVQADLNQNFLLFVRVFFLYIERRFYLGIHSVGRNYSCYGSIIMKTYHEYETLYYIDNKKNL